MKGIVQDSDRDTVTVDIAGKRFVVHREQIDSDPEPNAEVEVDIMLNDERRPDQIIIPDE